MSKYHSKFSLIMEALETAQLDAYGQAKDEPGHWIPYPVFLGMGLMSTENYVLMANDVNTEIASMEEAPANFLWSNFKFRADSPYSVSIRYNPPQG